MLIKINEEVKHALENNIPVVALESTIISHGMPYPQNVETAMKVEKIIRENGCVPATIGIIEGTPIVGMSAEEIELFGKTKGILKVSRRDLPVVMAKKAWGATTVSTTTTVSGVGFSSLSEQPTTLKIKDDASIPVDNFLYILFLFFSIKITS